MLSSTADNLYWMGRYIERAENTARLLAASNRMSLIAGPERAAGQSQSQTQGRGGEWRSVATIYGIEPEAIAAESEAPEEKLLRTLCFDRDNASSIVACVQRARNNARAERNNLTVEAWENINATWLELAEVARKGVPPGEYRPFFEWVKRQSHLILGSLWTTLLRDEAFDFLHLGIFIERADNTARILDVKYHRILPDGAPRADVVDYYEWAELLACVSAVRAYKRIYQSGIEPWRVAEFLLLRRDLPRSLHYCLGRVDRHLNSLADFHGHRHECHRISGVLYSRLRYGQIERIFRRGLHPVLTDFIGSIAELSEELRRNYLMTT
ncbi:alpha-E domain-containing protein [Desertibaculum subflavum]|uniref:alpha-E domain-containing protein n=1 Tax=Desertibaculum subflavum TaxID=2268458 RepID=UPI000E662D4E